MAKTSSNNITDWSQRWDYDPANGLPFNGNAVQDFISSNFSKKVGSWSWSESDEYYHLLGFATEVDKNKYLEDPKTYSNLLLVDETLPISITKDEYGAFVWCDIPSTKDLIVNGDSLNVNLRFSSVKITGGEKFNLGLTGSITIQRKTTNSDWVTVAVLNNIIQSTDYTDTENYTKIDLGNYLITGK